MGLKEHQYRTDHSTVTVLIGSGEGVNRTRSRDSLPTGITGKGRTIISVSFFNRVINSTSTTRDRVTRPQKVSPIRPTDSVIFFPGFPDVRVSTLPRSRTRLPDRPHSMFLPTPHRSSHRLYLDTPRVTLPPLPQRPLVSTMDRLSFGLHVPNRLGSSVPVCT